MEELTTLAADQRNLEIGCCSMKGAMKSVCKTHSTEFDGLGKEANGGGYSAAAARFAKPGSGWSAGPTGMFS
jgi:hypothetical protein